MRLMLRGEIKIRENGPMDGIGYTYSPEASDDDPRGDWQSRVVWWGFFVVGAAFLGVAIIIATVE